MSKLFKLMVMLNIPLYFGSARTKCVYGLEILKRANSLPKGKARSNAIGLAYKGCMA